jgi:hypothetical protein
MFIEKIITKKRKKLKKKELLFIDDQNFFKMFSDSLDYILSESKIKMAENCF